MRRILGAGRKRGFLLLAVVAAVLCLGFSLFLPSIHSQVSGFVLPCTITTTGNAWDGCIAFDLMVNSSSYYLVVMDTNGTVLAVRESNTPYDAAWNVAPDTLMFLGEPEVNGADSAPTFATHIWNLSTGETENFPNVISEHDLQYDPVNNTFLALQQYVQPSGNHLYLIDKIVQLDPNGTVVWTWNPYDYIPLSDASPFNETGSFNGQTVIDFTHANTLDWDYNDSIIYVNFRNLNTFYAINQTSGDIIWGCGEWGNFTLLGANGQPLTRANGLPPSLWYHCHTVEEVAPDVFTMFNNDYENNSNPDDCRSSLMEVTLNETSMTASVNWSWEAPTAYWTEYGGSCVLLPNGDFLGDFGDPSHEFDQNAQPDGSWNFTDSGAVFVEVNSAEQVVRTFTFPVGCYVYRVEPINNPASIVLTNSSPIITITATPSPTATPTPSPTTTPLPNLITSIALAATPSPTPCPIITPTPIPVTTPTPSAAPLNHTPYISPNLTPPMSIGSGATTISVILGLIAIVVITVAGGTLYTRKRINRRADISQQVTG